MIQAIEANRYMGLGLSAFDPNLSLPRHRWYEFKEGFSEQLVKLAIDHSGFSSKTLRILDPFVGSGTSVVTAGRLGLSAVGIEVNPFLNFAARAKCTRDQWTERGFKKAIDGVLALSCHEVRSPLEGVSTFTEGAQNEKWLFNRSVLRGFTSLQNALHGFPRYNRPLRLALFASLMDCCNAKRDGKCLRYQKNWSAFGYNSSHIREVFRRRAQTVFEDISEHSFYSGNLRILRGDSRKRLGQLESNYFDLLVTSPPYLNSFDYSDVYRPELFAGDFVANNEELRKIRLQTLRSHVQVKWKASTAVASTLLIPIFEQLSDVKMWSSQLPAMIKSYFVDMEEVLKLSARRMRPQGQAWIVVATSAYGGIEIPVDLILADIATRSGWALEGVYVLRQLRSAGQHWSRLENRKRLPLRESLIVLKRAKRVTR